MLKSFFLSERKLQNAILRVMLLPRPRMLKSFFLSELKLLNAILRVKLKYMKDVSFSWN